MADSCFYQNEMNQGRVGPQQQLPPRASFPPLGVKCRGGCLGWGVSRGGKERRGVLAYPVLCSLLTGLQSFILTDGVNCALLVAQNLTPWHLQTIRSRIPFCEASFCLRAKYGASKRRERVILPGASLDQWRVAPASVLQGVVSSHFAGRRKFGEHDGAGMERMASRRCAAVCASPGQPKWNGTRCDVNAF
jgi:hypothetical protein